eukprot:g2490.t1
MAKDFSALSSQWKKLSTTRDQSLVTSFCVSLLAITPEERIELWLDGSGARYYSAKHGGSLSSEADFSDYFSSLRDRSSRMPLQRDDNDKNTIESWRAPIRDQIDCDIHRSGVNPRLQVSLRAILLAFAERSQDIGYTQGMNFLVAMCLLQGMTEEQSFWVLVGLCETALKDYFNDTLSGVSRDSEVCEILLSSSRPKLLSLLEFSGVPLSGILSRMLMPLFVSTFPHGVVVRVWDACFVVGIECFSIAVILSFFEGINDTLGGVEEENLKLKKNDQKENDGFVMLSTGQRRNSSSNSNLSPDIAVFQQISEWRALGLCEQANENSSVINTALSSNGSTDTVTCTDSANKAVNMKSMIVAAEDVIRKALEYILGSSLNFQTQFSKSTLVEGKENLDLSLPLPPSQCTIPLTKKRINKLRLKAVEKMEERKKLEELLLDPKSAADFAKAETVRNGLIAALRALRAPCLSTASKELLGNFSISSDFKDEDSNSKDTNALIYATNILQELQSLFPLMSDKKNKVTNFVIPKSKKTFVEIGQAWSGGWSIIEEEKLLLAVSSSLGSIASILKSTNEGSVTGEKTKLTKFYPQLLRLSKLIEFAARSSPSVRLLSYIEKQVPSSLINTNRRQIKAFLLCTRWVQELQHCRAFPQKYSILLKKEILSARLLLVNYLQNQAKEHWKNLERTIAECLATWSKTKAPQDWLVLMPEEFGIFDTNSATSKQLTISTANLTLLSLYRHYSLARQVASLTDDLYDSSKNNMENENGTDVKSERKASLFQSWFGTPQKTKSFISQKKKKLSKQRKPIGNVLTLLTNLLTYQERKVREASRVDKALSIMEQIRPLVEQLKSETKQMDSNYKVIEQKMQSCVLLLAESYRKITLVNDVNWNRALQIQAEKYGHQLAIIQGNASVLRNQKESKKNEVKEMLRLKERFKKFQKL